ncbi:MAG TPA: hypothetical protein VK327_13425, partial [Candidatus Paceibacterota bacterium]|nr:hypothetical protein [Candidatus Paceibacterota bacterium]
ILSAPMVKGMVVGREVKIAGNFSEAEALQIVNALNDPARANTFRPFRAISNPVELEIKRRDEAVPPVQK